MIEDSLTDRKVIEKAIDQANQLSKFNEVALIDYAYNLHSAIEMLEKNQYDVALVDLTLPDSSGVSTIAKLRSITKIPLVIISGAYSRQAFETAVKGGVSRFILKGENWTVGIATLITRLLHEHQILSKALGFIKNAA